MAQEAVNTVVQALQRGFEGVQAQRNSQQQREEFEANLALQKQEADERKRQFDVQQTAAQKLFELNQSAQELSRMQAEQNIATQAATTGIVPPGAIAGPAQINQQTGVGYTPIQNNTQPQGNLNYTPVPGTAQPGQGNYLNIQFPSGHVLTVPTPATLAKTQADVARIANAPLEEAKTREEQARQESETARQLAIAQKEHEDRMAELLNQQNFLAEQQKRSLAGTAANDSNNNAVRLKIAQMQATGGLSGLGGTFSTDENGNPVFGAPESGGLLGNVLKQGYNGQLSIENLRKQFQPKVVQQITAHANEIGMQFLTDKQQKSLQDLNAVAGIIPQLAQMHQIRDDSPLLVNVPGTDAYKTFNSLKDQVEGGMPNVERVLSSMNRYNPDAAKAYAKSMMPSTTPFFSGAAQEKQKFNQFVSRDVQNAFNSTLSNLPQNQQDAIREGIGFNKFPYLKGALQTPGVEPGTPRGANPATIPLQVNKPPKAGQILVIDKKSGSQGWLSPQYFDSSKYQKVGQ